MLPSCVEWAPCLTILQAFQQLLGSWTFPTNQTCTKGSSGLLVVIWPLCGFSPLSIPKPSWGSPWWRTWLSLWCARLSTRYSEVGQGTGLHGSHHPLEQTTLLCSYLEVTFSSKQVLKAKASKKKKLFTKSKINTTVTKIREDTSGKMEREVHLIYLFQDKI